MLPSQKNALQRQTMAIRVIFIDTETNGLPKNKYAPASMWQAYPAILQLSWILCTVDGRNIRIENKRDIHVRLPEGDEWDKYAAGIHGISEEDCCRGMAPKDALTALHGAMSSADCVVAHNLAFDKSVIRAAGSREGLDILWPSDITEFCTMYSTRDLLQLPSSPTAKYAYKVPRLSELYEWLYGHTYDICGDALHSSRADTYCLMHCLQGLLRKGHVVVDGKRLVINRADAV